MGYHLHEESNANDAMIDVDLSSSVKVTCCRVMPGEADPRDTGPSLAFVPSAFSRNTVPVSYAVSEPSHGVSLPIDDPLECGHDSKREVSIDKALVVLPAVPALLWESSLPSVLRRPDPQRSQYLGEIVIDNKEMRPDSWPWSLQDQLKELRCTLLCYRFSLVFRILPHL